MSGTTRRKVIVGAGALAAAGGGIAAGYHLGSSKRASRALGKKVIIIGIDGMDPRLCSRMMDAGELPTLRKLRDGGGFSGLGTSTPPQSPVAWANFINGAGPGSHGIFDFIHRHPEHQCDPFYSAAETVPGHGGWEVGKHRLQFDFWPFNHQLPHTELRRKGTPFWEYLETAGVPSTFYDLPSNYPPSPSKRGLHRCICGMGVPDMLGTYGTYQYFAEDAAPEPLEEGGGKRVKLEFDNDTARTKIVGPEEGLLKKPKPIEVELLVHRDRDSNAAALELGGKRVLLKQGQWSRWTRIDFPISAPGSCRLSPFPGFAGFTSSRFHPYSSSMSRRSTWTLDRPHNRFPSPRNSSPMSPRRSGRSIRLGSRRTTRRGRTGSSTTPNSRQAEIVLEERFALFEHAIKNYEDGLLFFYFSSSDLQSHIFWWDSDEKHPIREPAEARARHNHVKKLYQRLDSVIGRVVDTYGKLATIIVMSDHGFGNFGRQFNVNSWLRDYGYLGPRECTSILRDVDWASTKVYGLGINGLYLNMKGREREGIVEPGEERETLLAELIERLEAITDFNGEKVIRGVYRSDRIYKGNATALAPDLIIGYTRGYRASWATVLGDLTEDVLLDNDSAWSADHCAMRSRCPGSSFPTAGSRARRLRLWTSPPRCSPNSGIETPKSMVGKNVFAG